MNKCEILGNTNQCHLMVLCYRENFSQMSHGAKVRSISRLLEHLADTVSTWTSSLLELPVMLETKCAKLLK